VVNPIYLHPDGLRRYHKNLLGKCKGVSFGEEHVSRALIKVWEFGRFTVQGNILESFSGIPERPSFRRTQQSCP
jgi:hypothetical protein